MAERDKRYGRQHRARRAEWARRIAAGGVPCARCGRTIVRGMKWHLDHDDTVAGRYLGPSHAFCNMSWGGVKGNAVRAASSPLVRPTAPRPAPKPKPPLIWSRHWGPHGPDVVDCPDCREGTTHPRDP
jgi:hypothetical protein